MATSDEPVGLSEENACASVGETDGGELVVWSAWSMCAGGPDDGVECKEDGLAGSEAECGMTCVESKAVES